MIPRAHPGLVLSFRPALQQFETVFWAFAVGGLTVKDGVLHAGNVIYHAGNVLVVCVFEFLLLGLFCASDPVGLGLMTALCLRLDWHGGGF